MSGPRDRQIRLTEWADGWHWTVFDADPDFQSDRVEGVLVPYAIAEQREPSQTKALRKALTAAAAIPGGTQGCRVLVPLAPAAAWAVICETDHCAPPDPKETQP